MLASQLFSPAPSKPLPNQYDCLKSMQSGTLGLYKLAVNALKVQFNIDVYDRFFNDYEYSSIIVVPEEVFVNPIITKKIDAYVKEIFLKYSLKVINSGWKIMDEYDVDWQGSKHNTYIVGTHYYFEVVPFRCIDYSNVYRKERVFDELKGWNILTIPVFDTYFVTADYVSIDDVD